MLRSMAAWAAFLVLVPAPVPQELKSEHLDQLKSSTVYVVVGHRNHQGTGSGFLFLKRGSSAYVMTCEHVVGPAEKVDLVFWSGTANERKYEARVMATDPHRDLACLMIENATDLPSTFEVGLKTTVKETETVFAAGFPFGRGLAAGEKNPEITISKSTVSSIRTDRSGQIVAVQISGEVQPGNSGGPLVALDGRVLGVVAAKVQGTGTAFAVPSEEIQKFLAGGIGEPLLRKVEGSDKHAKYEVAIPLVNPFRDLKSVGIAYIVRKAVDRAIPSPEKDGKWSKVHPDMREVPLKIEGRRAAGALEFSSDEKDPEQVIRIMYQCYFTRADGSTVWMAPVTFAVRLGLGEDRPPPTPEAGRPSGSKPATPDEDEPPDPPAPPAISNVPLAVPAAPTISIQMGFTSAFGGLALSPDGTFLYALDLSEALLYKLDPDTLAIKAKLDVASSSNAMSLTPDGKTIYIVGSDASHSRTPGQPVGLIQVISTDQLKPVASMSTQASLFDVVATDRGLLVASVGRVGDQQMTVIDVKSRSEHKLPGWVAVKAHLRLSLDQKRAYFGDTIQSPGGFHAVELWRQQGTYPLRRCDGGGDGLLGGACELTPDGRFLIGSRGSVLRLSKNRNADLQVMGKVDRCQSIALAAGCDSFFTFNADGFVRTYALEDFVLVKSTKLGWRCDMAVLDVRRKKIHGVFGPVLPETGVDRPLRAGRIGSIALSSP